jgi:hypothetical protein
MGKITRGLTDITAIKRGTTAVSKVYRGQALIWEPVSPTSAFIEATGGTVITRGAYKIHSFTTIGSGSFVVTNAPALATASLLVVAGGGGGGFGGGGGGGAGEYLFTTSASISPQTYTLVVGDGGAGQTSTTGVAGASGLNSQFGSFTLLGGGGGGEVNLNGVGGGSGGGSGKDGALGGSKSGSWVGNAGGGAGGQGSSGGGGAGAAGVAGGAAEQSGNGGVGLFNNISGTSTFYAGGGGGGANSTTAGKNGTGGTGGGGNGALNNLIATAGTDGLGGGGGGGAYSDGVTNARYGKDGGSGIVVVKYQYQTIPWVTTSLRQYIDPFTSTISSTTATDLSGNGNSATLVNSIAVVGNGGGGDSGWQLNVTGGSAKALNLGLSNTDFNTGGGSLEIWFKIDTASWDSEPGMIYQYRVSPDRQFGLGMKSTADKRFYSQVQGSTTAAEVIPTGDKADGVWRQFVIALAAGGAGYRLYVNGTDIGGTTTTVGNVNAVADFYAGGRIGSFVRGYADAWMGLTRVYTKQLSAAEVLQNYNANKADYGL